MASNGRYGPVLRQVGRLLGGGTIAALGTKHLLDRFASTRDEAAFEALVNQHGPMVLGTCRRMLADPQDVEDAFQATFLVLARRASSIEDAERLGPWLHGVARRVASRSRALSARRNALERETRVEPSAVLDDALEASELRAALDEELARLPEKYRSPLVLCYLEGLTHDEAAQRLRWPVGTVRSRLAGGRDRLRDRLTRRGLAPASSVPALLARASIPPPLLSATVRLATSAGAPSAHVATLVKGVLIAMIGNKLKVVAAIGLTAALTVGGVGIAAQQQGEAGQGQAKSLKVVASKPEDDLAKLQGRWRLREVDPARSDLAELPRVDWLFEGKTATLIVGGESKQRSEFILGSQGGQKTIDLRATEDGSKTLGFYRFLGDELEVCLGAPGKLRPETFRLDNSPYSEIFRFEKLSDAITKLDDRIKPVEEGPAERERLEKQLEAEKAKKKELVLRSEKMQNEWWDLTEQETREASTRRAILEAEGKTLGLENRISDATIALLTLRLQRFDLSKAQPPGVPAKEAADPKDEANPSFYVHILELKKKEEELKSQLKLLEIDNKELSADFNPPMDRAKAKAAIEGMNQTIQQLERDVASKSAQIDAFAKEVGTRRKAAPAGKESRKAAQNVVARTPADQPPQVTRLQGNYVVVIPSEQDRVTILNTETGTKATHRFPGPLKQIRPFPSSGMVALNLDDPEIRQLAIFNIQDGKWYPQDLKEPTTNAKPIVGATQAVYQLGRFIYVFNTAAKKWGVLELKKAPRQNGDFSGLGGFDDGKIIIPEDNVIHIYDPRTGEWTQTDTNGPDVAKPLEKPDVPAAKPVENAPEVVKPQNTEPRVLTLNGNPQLFLVISPKLDRATMIDPGTRERKTYRLPEGLTEVNSIDSGRLVGLMMKGPKINRVGLYDRKTQGWIEHELKEPATEVHPIMSAPLGADQSSMVGLWLKGPEITRLDVFDGHKGEWTTQELREPVKGGVAPIVTSSTATYRIGRFLYIYSLLAGKWAVLELKREDAGLQGGFGGGGRFAIGPDGNDRLMIHEDDVIHLYDVKTGEWTHIETKDEK